MSMPSLQRICRTLFQLAAGTCLVASLSGCIVQDIHDQMANANTKLDVVNDSVNQSNERVAEADEKLASLDEQLVAIAETNERLKSVDERLAVHESIDKSLKALDHHLASLRETIDNIDSTIPFLKFSSDDEEGEETTDDTGAEDPEAGEAPGD